MSDSVPVYKVVLVGDGEVGKTSLVRRYCENKFSESRVETIGIDFQSKTVGLSETEMVCLLIWDVAGQDRFASFRDQYYSGALAIALVYDATSPASFFNLQHWHKEVRRAVPGVPVAVIANKADLPHVVPMAEAQGWAGSINYPFLATSAKTGENVDTLFRGLAQMAHQHLKDLESFEDLTFGSNRRQTFD